ncbi:hypothetical protein [Caldalkalibacillus salinus]|uniref:hypothetical protein n=1 Tax=Caldalkalibacillus salinus TaxID=2803787 RepID=UPI0019246D6D|nr:hypothetical protein [Caldalkalibacillus salinus]
MDFFVDLGLFAVIIVVLTAFLGVLATKIAESFNRKKRDVAFQQNDRTKQGWKRVSRPPN